MNIPLLKELHKAHSRDAKYSMCFSAFANWIHNSSDRTYEDKEGKAKTIKYEVKPCTR